MNELYPIHKKILSASVIIIVALFGFYRFILSPLQTERLDLWNTIENSKGEITKKTPWANDDHFLTQVEQQVNKNYQESRNNIEYIKAAAQILSSRIQNEELVKEFSDLKKSSLNARFRQEYKDFCNFLKQKNLSLPNPQFFKMNAKSLDTQIETLPAWQLILKLWTAEAAINLLEQANLTIIQEKSQTLIDDRKQTLFFCQKENDPFLITLPIAFKIRGTASQFYQLFTLCNQHENFLPISYLEIFLDPQNNKESQVWEGIVEFSGFLPIITDEDDMWAVPSNVFTPNK